MAPTIDPTRDDKDAEIKPPKVVKGTGQPADNIPDGSGNNTSSDNMGDDAASGG